MSGLGMRGWRSAGWTWNPFEWHGDAMRGVRLAGENVETHDEGFSERRQMVQVEPGGQQRSEIMPCKHDFHDSEEFLLTLSFRQVGEQVLLVTNPLGIFLICP